jgi:hypothetical protein
MIYILELIFFQLSINTQGITAHKGFKMMTVDNFSAEYITTKALATRQTTEKVIHEMIARELAAVV